MRLDGERGTFARESGPTTEFTLDHHGRVIMGDNAEEMDMLAERLAGEIMRRMRMQSAIVVSDGYHIYRVKKMLEGRGLTVYGSPRPERVRDSLRARWNYVKQAVGSLLWSCGVPV